MDTEINAEIDADESTRGSINPMINQPADKSKHRSMNPQINQLKGD